MNYLSRKKKIVKSSQITDNLRRSPRRKSDASLSSSQKEVEIKSPPVAKKAELSAEIKAACPLESASETSQNTQLQLSATESQQLAVPLAAKTNTDSSQSTLNSEKINKNAVCSTPEKRNINPKKTFRETIKSLKQKLEDPDTSTELIEILGDSVVDVLDPGPFSQRPKTKNRRERLLWLQERRGIGLWVLCDNPECGKWRWLDNPDPDDLPDKWYCYMNEDPQFASCSVPEKPVPIYKEIDMIHNCYTAGTVVWAKAPGYCWWPAMVDDCPDTEQFYWLDDFDEDVPTSYHVVFFDDKEVSRLWLPPNKLKSFKNYRNFDAEFKVPKKFRRRLAIAKEKASDAITLTIKERLRKYSFISLWDKELPDFSSSDDSDMSDIDFDGLDMATITKKVIERRQIKKSQKKEQKGSPNKAKKATKDRLNKSAPLFGTKKEAKLRRHSAASEPKKVETNESLNKNIVKEMIDTHPELFNSKIDYEKFENIYQKVTKKSSENTKKITKRRVNSPKTTKKFEEIKDKKPKLNDKVKSPKKGKVIKKNKHFILPIKKTLNTSVPSTSSLTNNLDD